ncbi:MAG TPA: hypothetical protein VLC91_16830 [Spongiibacteraceae bacterium]|nr:hypothetical protein [Spongiibacteraceae bacterium]
MATYSFPSTADTGCQFTVGKNGATAQVTTTAESYTVQRRGASGFANCINPDTGTVFTIGLSPANVATFGQGTYQITKALTTAGEKLLLEGDAAPSGQTNWS